MAQEGQQFSEGEKQQIKAALEKKRGGGKLTRGEQRLLQRYLKGEEERKRKETFAGIRKGEWCAWSGRQVKVLNEQAQKHGIPIGRETIDLPAVVRWLHDFLAENKHRLADRGDGGGDGSGTEEYKREMAKFTRVKRERLEEKLVPAEEVQEMLGAWAELSRRFGERLARLPGAGAEAHRMYEDYRAECERLLSKARDAGTKGHRDEG